MHKILKQFVFLVVLLSTVMYGTVLSYAAAPIFSNLDGDNPTIMVSSIGPLDANGDSTVTYGESPNFNGGHLSIQLTSGIANGSFSVSGSGVTGVSAGTSILNSDSSIEGTEIIFVDGVAIASVSAGHNGQNGNNLIFNFGSNATPARAQALIRALRYTAPTVGDRVFDIVLSHGSETSDATTVVISVVAPEIAVQQGITDITSGGSYNYGIYSVNSDTDFIFTIANTGTGDLILTSEIAISGVNADQFSVQAQPVLTIAAVASTTFTVRFSPTSEGNKTAAIEIVSNDTDEGSYTINLSGTGVITNTNSRSRHQTGKVTYKADAFENGERTSSLTVNTNSSEKNVSVNISSQMGADLMEGNSLTVNMPSIDNMNSYSIEMESGYLASESGKGTLAFHTDAGSLTIPLNMLDDEVNGTSIKITIADGGIYSLTDEVNGLIGDRPIIRLLLEVDGEETAWSNPDAPVTVSIPYTPTVEELIHPESIAVWYIDGSGNAVCVSNGFYDADAGAVTFKTTHFSLFAVGYNPVEYNDVTERAWYSDYVRYLAARDIVRGNYQFRPDAKITRAEFVSILARMSGEDMRNLNSPSFSDVKSSDWYFTAAHWAFANNIATGSDGKFNPNENITREQMTAMLYRYAEYAGGIPNPEGISPLEFSDYGNIANWAQASVQWAVSSGIVTGNTDGSFAPRASTTRAQAAKMIALLLQDFVGSI